jgi:serine-type D-Ala-D-Ala carboxypeptidase/endopeptidase
MTAGDAAARVAAVLADSTARHAGLVIAIQSRGEAGYWWRGRLPDGPATILEIGSVTKTFTTTLLADMARERMVSLDDPVQRHLPAGLRLPVRGREITLEDLATHRSGLPRLPKGLLWLALTGDRRDPYARVDEARLAAAIGATRPRREPGRRVAYSNYGMGLLGHVLALRAGTSYEQLVRARICEPLGLDDTWVDTPESERPRVATGHTWLGREAAPWHLAALAGCGGLRSTAADLLAFLRLHFATSDSPLAAAAADTARSRAPWRRNGEIGLGWVIVPLPQRQRRGRSRFRVLLHEGGTGGFRSFAGVIPALDVGAVVLANQARSVGLLGLRVLDALAHDASSLSDHCSSGGSTLVIGSGMTISPRSLMFDATLPIA